MIIKWRVPKENHQKHLEFWSEMMDYQRAHPEKFHYTESRFYSMTKEGSSEERWVAIDKYRDREAVDQTTKNFSEDPEVVRMALFPRWDALIVPGSREVEVWAEVEDLAAVFGK
jgi:hypothetical protein